MALEFTKENFQSEVLEAQGPVLVDFWAVWCGPCRQIAPIIEQLASENKDLKIGKLDVDANQEIALKYNVTNIPTIAIFKNGRVVDSLVGGRPKSELQALLNRHKDSPV